MRTCKKRNTIKNILRIICDELPIRMIITATTAMMGKWVLMIYRVLRLGSKV